MFTSNIIKLVVQLGYIDNKVYQAGDIIKLVVQLYYRYSRVYQDSDIVKLERQQDMFK